jgi:hypothetical protein
MNTRSPKSQHRCREPNLATSLHAWNQTPSSVMPRGRGSEEEGTHVDGRRRSAFICRAGGRTEELRSSAVGRGHRHVGPAPPQAHVQWSLQRQVDCRVTAPRAEGGCRVWGRQWQSSDRVRQQKRMWAAESNVFLLYHICYSLHFSFSVNLH